MMKSMDYQQLLKWLIPTLIAFSILFWLVKPEELPDEIRIAAGQPGGHYSMFSKALEISLHAETDREVETKETAGSIANGIALCDDTAELAVLQAGAAEM